MQQINSTTFLSSDLGDVKPVVTIGGKSNDKFIPNVNNSFHNEEFYFNLNCIDDIIADEPATKTDGVISQTINNEKHEYYIDDSGRLKWDKIFSSCPDSMRVRFKVRKSSGVHFYYQGELTPEEVADGYIRPDDIVGSYAVYCDKANNKYKTGKLCHIPRPFVIDATGNREWCAMTYEEISDTEGMLRIDMPEEFMKSAAYPVRLDPTIGYTTAGSGYFQLSDRILFSKTTSVSAGTAVPGIMHVYSLYATTEYLRFGLYNTNSGEIYGASKLSSDEEEISTTLGDTFAWFSGNITISGGISASTDYILAVHGDNCYIGCDDSEGAGGTSWFDFLTYTSGNNNLPTTGPNGTFRYYLFSLYLEYTESGGTGNSYYYQQQQM